LSTLLFLFVLISIFWLYRQSSFIQKTDLPFKWIIALFSARVLTGFFLKWMSDRYYPVNDYTFLQNEAYKEYQWLLKNPIDFALNLFQSPYDNPYGNFFNSANSYWKDLANNLIIKFQAILNLISRGNFYINCLLINSIGFLGSIAIYRTYIRIYPSNKWILIICSFLIPSTLYFSSGIHKDLFVFTALGLLIYSFNELGTNRFKVNHLFLMIFSLITIALLRNFLLVCLIPCSVAYLICKYTKIKSSYIYITATILLFAFTIAITSINPNFSPWKWIVERQNEFLQLKKAGSQLTMHKLENNSKSIIENVPMALEHGFFRPFVWDASNLFSILLGVELYLFWVLAGISLFWMRKMDENTQTPIIGFAILLSILMITSIGYIVPNSSSIVRYRSLYLPFLLIPIWVRFSKKATQSNTL
jgi:hypothetical protein